MQFGVDGKSINFDLHCSDDKSHWNPFAQHDDSAHACLNEVQKLRDSALEWVNKNGEKTRKEVQKDETREIGELSRNAQHLFDNFEHVYSHKRDQFMDFLKGQKEKQEPFEEHVLDFRHEIQDLFKK